MLYVIFKEIKKFGNFKNGWESCLKESDIDVVDDIKRIYYYRNFICYLDVLNMKINIFNEFVLDLLGVMYFYRVLYDLF